MLVATLDEAKEALDGVMLSGGNLAMHGRNARFHLDLSGEEHLDWLYYTKSSLLTLGAMVSSVYPKVSLAYSKGKPYNLCRVQSCTSPILTVQYNRWYLDGKKEVPDDLKLAPVVLANWLMGDGNSKWYEVNWVYVRFATYRFNQTSIERLTYKLSGVGVKHVTQENVESGTGLVVGNVADVHRLMDMTELHILPSYIYKIKKPRARKPATGIYYKEENEEA